MNEEEYDPTLALANVLDFAFHLSELASAGQCEEFPALFTALEAAYVHAKRHDLPNVNTLLTVGFLEDLIYAFEEKQLDSRLIEPYLAGPESQAGWRAAYAYTHDNR